MKAKLTQAAELVGPDKHPREYPADTIVEGKAARVAIANGWAEEISDAAAAAFEKAWREADEPRPLVGLTTAAAVPAEELEAAQARIAQLEQQLADAGKLAEAGQVEGGQLLAEAEAKAETIVANARAEAERITAEAKTTAERIEAEARAAADRVTGEALDQAKAGNGRKGGKG